MNKVDLQNLVGGALQEKFERAFEKVVDNLQDLNTSFKVKRKISITLSFDQNETRDDVSVSVDVAEKLAPQKGMETKFNIGKDLKTGEVFAYEYGKQIPGQMNLHDCDPSVQKIGDDIVDTETGEIMGNGNQVIDLREAAH